MFQFLKQAFSKVTAAVTTPLRSLFNKPALDEQELQELRRILLAADTGYKQTEVVLQQLQQVAAKGTLSGAQAHELLTKHLHAALATCQFTTLQPIIMLVGINGSGKTTTVAKLAHLLQSQGKRVMVAAADTFRAAAVDQLQAWGDRLQIPVVVGAPESDPAAVVYAAAERFIAEQYDYLIIDTAGRLHTKTHLMKELEKVRRVITKKLPETGITTLLTVDAMLGQNSFDQAKLFHESTPLDGIVLTKMDGTGKGGIVIAITAELKIPVAYLTFGEQPEDISAFNADEYLKQLLG